MILTKVEKLLPASICVEEVSTSYRSGPRNDGLPGLWPTAGAPGCSSPLPVDFAEALSSGSVGGLTSEVLLSGKVVGQSGRPRQGKNHAGR